MSLGKSRLLIAIPFVISLGLPAFTDSGPGSAIRGWFCLIAIPTACLFPAWWANPFLFASFFALSHSKFWARIFGILALTLSLSFLFYDPIINRSRFALFTGYWFWLASMAATVVISFIAENHARPQSKVGSIEEI